MKVINASEPTVQVEFKLSEVNAFLYECAIIEKRGAFIAGQDSPIDEVRKLFAGWADNIRYESA